MNNSAMAYYATSCLIIFTIFMIILKFRRRRHFFKQASKFAGPPTLPLIGNAHLLTGSTEDILDKLMQLGKVYDAPYRIWLGSTLVIVINTPEQLKIALHNPKAINKGHLFGMVRPWLGTGLLTASVWNIIHTTTEAAFSAQKWRVHRKLIQPAFSTTILNSFVEIFAAQSLSIAREMERNLDGPDFDIYNYTSQYTLYTICDTSMGVKLETQTDGNGCYADILEKVVASVCRRVVSPWLHPDFIFRHTKIGKEQEKNIKFLHAFTNNVIQAKHKELLESHSKPDLIDINEDTSSSTRRRQRFLDHLIEISGRDSEILSDEALREEVDTVMAAGSDTTAIMSSFLMLMLASHPEIQEKAYQELCEIYQDYDTEELRVTPEDLTRMTYMDRVIKETMRLFPITPLLARSVVEDLDIDDHTLPAGSTIAISLIELHRNGDIWPDPLKFDPDRFLPEEVKKRDSYTYLPFSGGPRNCIGSKYAMMSMKTMLATILQRYVLKKDNIMPVKDIRLKWEFLLRPVEPITVKIERRSRGI